MTPTELTIATYICEEVRRQGHDLSSQGDGVKRVRGMWAAWDLALKLRAEGTHPTVEIVKTLGSLVEDCNQEGFRTVRIRVGWEETGSEIGLIGSDLEALLSSKVWWDREPLECYRAFERIHPFLDGNGRTGKILLAWRANRLEDPFFPPRNFWGHPIQNP